MKNLAIAIILMLLALFVLGSIAQAETIYIQIPIEAQEKYTAAGFAVDYEVTTGEGWVMMNMRETKAENMMMGSWRITWEQCNTELKTRWPMISCYKQIDQELPTGWVRKIELE